MDASAESELKFPLTGIGSSNVTSGRNSAAAHCSIPSRQSTTACSCRPCAIAATSRSMICGRTSASGR